MGKNKLTGKCGLYCGACNIYRAQKDGGELLDSLAIRFSCRPEQICCQGCGGLTEACWGNGCKIVLCLRAKGYDFCYECSDYESRSCESYESHAKGYLSKAVDIRGNLEKIKAGKEAEWLEESEHKFTCASCGKPMTAVLGKCHHCGAVPGNR